MFENNDKPFWHKELEVFSKAVNVIILEGNVLDRFCYPEDNSIVSLREYLYFFYSDIGYENIVFYDDIQGFGGYEGIKGKGRAIVEEFERLSEIPDNAEGRIVFSAENNEYANCKTTAMRIEYAMQQSQKPVVIVMDYSSRYIVSPEDMTKGDVDSFLHIQKGGLYASASLGANGALLNNLIILVVNKLNDLPAWFYLNNPSVHTVTISKPTLSEREKFIGGSNFRSFFSDDRWKECTKLYKDKNEELDKIKKNAAVITDGLMYSDLISISKISSSLRFDIKDLKSAVDVFKYGIVDQNPWNKIDAATIDQLRYELSNQVLGQDPAIEHIMSVVERAAMGISNFFDENSSKPKGVLFFAGPTGTGKTQTAKIIARTLFKNERSCRIFDMSEYRSEHSDQRLLGAPPGYVGYEAGGQLTNAVRENPFSIFLFDEIEKAHPSILDKFLQILGDGRLTDGMGRTVYFTDSLIIFTSNLGIYGTKSDGTKELLVDPDDENSDYETVKEKVTGAINSYFRLELQRAEILNRIGKNVVVFDFIRSDVSRSIVTTKIKKFIDTMLSLKGIYLTVSHQAQEKLIKMAEAEKLDGGRGIENMLEYNLVNNVATYIYKNELKKGSCIIVEDVVNKGGKISLVINREHR